MTNGNDKYNEKYKLLAEFLKFSHDLVAKKFRVMVVVNGILFSVFNLLNIQENNSSYRDERFTLSLMSMAFSTIWIFNIYRSIKYTKYFKEKMNDIADRTTINIFDKEMWKKVGILSSGDIVLFGAKAQIVLWGVLFFANLWFNEDLTFSLLIGIIILLCILVIQLYKKREKIISALKLKFNFLN